MKSTVLSLLFVMLCGCTDRPSEPAVNPIARAGARTVVAETMTAVPPAYDEGPLLLTPRAVREASGPTAEAPRALRFEIVVSSAGRVVAARPLGPTADDVPDRFTRALGAMEFAPATLSGRPVAARLEMTIVL